MSFLTDVNWLYRIAYLHQGFKWITPSRTAACRCRICGDSQKNKRKTRGYFYTHEGELKYKCHNCGENMGFGWYIKTHLPEMYPEYRLEKFKGDKVEKLTFPTTVEEKPVEIKEVPVASCDELAPDHPAVSYLISREIPKSSWKRIKYVTRFREWVLKHGNLTRYSHIPNDARIIFELRDSNNVLFGVQGRVIGEVAPGAQRFITLKFNESKPRFYGLDFLKPDAPKIIVEGPIDSLFLPNCGALCGGDVSTVLGRFDKESTWVALDNEPRSLDTIHRMEKAIGLGYKVCFWQIDPKYKDINDMVHKGKIPTRTIIEHIVQNSYSGAKATVMLSKWRKIKDKNVNSNRPITR